MNRIQKIWLGVFIAPTILIFLIFYAYPLFIIFTSSFTDWKLASRINFIGIANYKELLLNDSVFRASLYNTIRWLLLQCTLHVSLGVLVALLTMNKSIFSRFVRTVYLIPNMISVAALAMLFYFVFQPSVGIINQFIRLLGFTDFNQNWYGEFGTAFLAVTLTTIVFAGVTALLVSSEIASISTSVFESAKIDGANEVQKNFYITLPMIKNIIGTCLILGVMSVLKTFEVIYLTTRGGPGNETMNLSMYLYRVAMSNNNFGYSNAIAAFTILLGVLAITLISKGLRMGESYN